MIDTSQILIIAAITVMTVLLTVIGIQLIFILRDIRDILKKVKNITNEFESLGFGISGSFGEVLGFFAGAKKLFEVIDHVTKTKKSK